MLLHYTGTKYQEDVYHFKLDGGDPRAQWLEKKFTLGLAFPNLPYYIDGIILTKLLAECSATLRVYIKNIKKKI
jgi:glutathione S-transferase